MGADPRWDPPFLFFTRGRIGMGDDLIEKSRLDFSGWGSQTLNPDLEAFAKT